MLSKTRAVATALSAAAGLFALAQGAAADTGLGTNPGIQGGDDPRGTGGPQSSASGLDPAGVPVVGTAQAVTSGAGSMVPGQSTGGGQSGSAGAGH
jgi:hypothetical protein